MIRQRSLSKALLRSEFCHLGNSAIYLINSCLGTLVCTVGAVVILTIGWKLAPILNSLGDFRQYFCAVVAGISVLGACMNCLTSCIISIEGKNLWIKRSMPVNSCSILFAKLDVHCILTCIPAMLLSLSLCIVAQLNIAESFLCLATSCVYGLLTGITGLVIELKNPKLNCMSEVVAVKQNTNTLIAIGLDMSYILISGSLYLFVLRKFMNSAVYVGILLGGLIAVAVLMIRWLKTKGVKLLESL